MSSSNERSKLSSSSLVLVLIEPLPCVFWLLLSFTILFTPVNTIEESSMSKLVLGLLATM